jgi:hypothetical protein
MPNLWALPLALYPQLNLAQVSCFLQHKSFSLPTTVIHCYLPLTTPLSSLLEPTVFSDHSFVFFIIIYF